MFEVACNGNKRSLKFVVQEREGRIPTFFGVSALFGLTLHFV